MGGLEGRGWGCEGQRGSRAGPTVCVGAADAEGWGSRKGGGHTHVAETISLKLGPRAAQGHQFSREGTPCQFLRFSWE